MSRFALPEELLINHRRAYVRFHGTPPYAAPYSEQILNTWANILQTSSLDEVWIYFNNTQNGYAPQNALFLKQLLTS